MLPKAAPQARIMQLGYESQWIGNEFALFDSRRAASRGFACRERGT